MSTRFKERRQHVRIPMVSVIQARHGDSGEMSPCMLVDVSASGVRLLSHFPLYTGDRLSLFIPLEEGEIVEAAGEIMWTKEMDLMKEYHFGVEYMAGMKFDKVNETIKKHIELFMEKR